MWLNGCLLEYCVIRPCLTSTTNRTTKTVGNQEISSARSYFTVHHTLLHKLIGSEKASTYYTRLILSLKAWFCHSKCIAYAASTHDWAHSWHETVTYRAQFVYSLSKMYRKILYSPCLVVCLIMNESWLEISCPSGLVKPIVSLLKYIQTLDLAIRSKLLIHKVVCFI